ncbi:hypothetical protein GCM10009632_05920 [Mycolicibacterium alvei]|uniref:Uncharacterized protein n=1 Tax=Mycolicibacterium alvei TaxID=67081 RepID=A0A6N4V3X9_9MYCO|nr:hypothetical protein [Mycolicibacterium alvei]BBX30462.1 hypothetical protein MALV_55870 [Mycolicibacterium alvei]
MRRPRKAARGEGIGVPEENPGPIVAAPTEYGGPVPAATLAAAVPRDGADSWWGLPEHGRRREAARQGMEDATTRSQSADPLRLRVGEVYDSGIRRWPGQELVLTTDGCVVLINPLDLTPEKISEFATADAHFAWIDARYNGILCCRFGSAPWEFLPFNPHRDTPHGKTPGMPAVEPRHRLAIPVGLISGGEAPVLAIRMVALPEHFVSAVRATVKRLAAQSFDADATVNESNYLYMDFRGERLVQRAGVRAVSRSGGANPG